MSTTQSYWYLIFTKVRSELKAKEHLERQDYLTYLPLTSKNCRRQGRAITVIEPFFPRYLFINLNQETDNWRPISSTVGVSSMVKFGGVPALVPADLIETLKSNEGQDGLQPTIEKKLQKGDKVLVTEGLFSGQYGIYQQPKGQDRVAILLDIVGKNTQVTMNIHDLQPI